MKFTVNKKEIESGLQKISGTLGRDGNLLTSFQLSANNGQLKIVASNMENSAQCTIKVEMEVPGIVLVNGKRLIDICSKINSENIIFELKEKVIIKGDGKKSAKYEIAFSNDESFPEFLVCRNMELIDGQTLKDIIEKTQHAASKDDNRYIYNGLQFNCEDGLFMVTATDGRRLATISEKLDLPIKDVVVHEKFIREILKNISDDMYIGVHEKEIFVKSGNIELSSRLLEGKFPDYKKILPTTGTEIEVNKKSLVDSINQIIIMTESPSFQIAISGNKIKTNIPDVGNSEVEIDFIVPCEIGINSQFLMDALKSIDSDNFIMVINNPVLPVLFKDGVHINLVMPMKIS